MSFSPEWLALREPADHAARDGALADRLREHFARRHEAGAPRAARPPSDGGPLSEGRPLRNGRPLRIVDLGCGAGSNLRYLSPRLPVPQRWTLVDNDPVLLRRLPPQPSERAACEPLEADLARDLERLPLAWAHVVTASALLDLVSQAWVERLIEQLARSGAARPALLFALSYDGRMTWTPGHPADDRIADAFNRHQRGDKGFGPAMGPTAAATTARLLRATGYEVEERTSDWELAAGGQRLQRELALGVAAALASEREAQFDDWLRFRLRELDAGRSTLRVGHVDLLALPGR